MASVNIKRTLIIFWVSFMFIFSGIMMSKRRSSLPSNNNSPNTVVIPDFQQQQKQQSQSSNYNTTTNAISISKTWSLSSSSSSSSSSPPSKAPKPGDPTYNTWCFDLHSNSIYTLGGKLNCSDNSQAFSMGLMVAVFFTVCIEIAVHSLEHHCTNVVTLEILNKMYRELMMMGFISFGINVLESIHLFELLFTVLNDSRINETAHDLTERRVKIFELVHICLFVLSIIYIIAVVISYFVCRVTWQKWSKFEILEKSERGYILRHYQAMKKKFDETNFILKFLNVKLQYDYSSSVEMASYFNVRHRFITIHKLTGGFRFDIYLKTRIRKLFLHLIDIGVGVWGTVFILAMLNYGRNKVFDFNTAGHGLWSFFGVLGVLPFGVCVILYLATRIAYSIYVRKNTVNKEVRQASINSQLQSGLLQSENDNTRDSAYFEVEPTMEELANIDYDVDMAHFFPLKQPKLVFFVMQLTLLAQSFYVAMLIIHFLNVALNEGAITQNYLYLNIAVYLLLYTPSLLVLFVFFPLTIAPFTVLTSVDNYTSHKIISYSYKRAEALKIRAHINKIMHEQPHYHPLRKQLKKSLTEHYPVLAELGDYHHEPYFVATSHKKKEHQKQLQNLIFYWNKRAKMLKQAKEKARQDQLANRNSKRFGSREVSEGLTTSITSTTKQDTINVELPSRPVIGDDADPEQLIESTNVAQEQNESPILLDMDMQPDEEFYDDDE